MYWGTLKQSFLTLNNYQVYDTNGKLVMNGLMDAQSEFAATLDVSGLPSGIYIGEIFGASDTTQYTIVKR